MDFNVILEFLRTYYKEIIEVSVLIISVVICLIRKKPSYNEIDTIKKDALAYLPSLISLVEAPGSGEQKKKAVLDLLSAFIRKKYGFVMTDDLFLFFSEAIESILSTPQKKGE